MNLTHNGEPITERDREMLVAGAVVMEKALIACKYPHPKLIRSMRTMVAELVLGASQSRVRSLYEATTRRPAVSVMATALDRMRETIPAAMRTVTGGFLGDVLGDAVQKSFNDEIARPEPDFLSVEEINEMYARTVK